MRRRELLAHLMVSLSLRCQGSLASTEQLMLSFEKPSAPDGEFQEPTVGPRAKDGTTVCQSRKFPSNYHLVPRVSGAAALCVC